MVASACSIDAEPLKLDWAAFHTIGLALAWRLKCELGSAARVIYEKPREAPLCKLNNRREVLLDGSLVKLAGITEIFGLA